jgi:hypothetical protein
MDPVYFVPSSFLTRQEICDDVALGTSRLTTEHCMVRPKLPDTSVGCPEVASFFEFDEGATLEQLTDRSNAIAKIGLRDLIRKGFGPMLPVLELKHVRPC